MRATLSFNLSDEADHMAHLRCLKATELALALFHFRESLIEICDTSENGKYIDEELVREAFRNSLDMYFIDLDGLIQ